MTALQHLQKTLSQLTFAAMGRRVTVGVVGLTDAAVSELDRALKAGSTLGPLDFVVQSGRGEVAVVAADLAADLSSEEWQTLFGDRPVVAVVEPGAPDVTLRTPYRVHSTFDDAEVASTLNSIPSLRQRAMGGRAPRPIEAETVVAGSPFVTELLRGWQVTAADCLLAGYDDGTSMLIDFSRGEVRADPGAWAHLQARRELPRLGDDDFAPPLPSHRAKVHRIEALVWAAGLASAQLPLLGAPSAWRQGRIAAPGLLQLERLCRAPAHRHLLELLSQHDSTPAQLRRATHVEERELCAFLQAGLFLRLLEWSR